MTADAADSAFVACLLAIALSVLPGLQASGQDAPQHTTIRFGPGRPAVAVDPKPESGALLVELASPTGFATPIFVRPAGPEFSLTAPPPYTPDPFRPPSIFSAPLPVGSGARALGFGGTFTAIADDATAASWNPAGLIQLKRPEVSAVYRNTWIRNEHASGDPGIDVGTDSYQSGGLNYLTAALPFRLPWNGRNGVVSLNYQEAYDFRSSFSARFADRRRQEFARTSRRSFRETQVDLFVFEPAGPAPTEVAITSEVATVSSSTLRQRIDTTLEADLAFEQEGLIDAVSPACAIEIHPRFAVGVAVNFYQDGLFESEGIRSVTRSRYVATSTSRSTVYRERTTAIRYEAAESTRGYPGAVTREGTLPESISAESAGREDVRVVEGEVVEENRYEKLDGANATLGMWWVVNDALTLGAAVDLPWEARGRQTRRVSSTSTTWDGARTHVLGTAETSEVSRQDVALEFPLFATAGLFYLWRPDLYTALDVGYTDWSSFAYELEDGGRINPFDGTPHGVNRVGDTWSVRLGTEYLLALNRQRVHVPLRCGLAWEQRPAIGSPDDYVGFSLGTGIALGRDANRWIFDIAYSYMQADDVQGIVPEEDALRADTRQQQLFFSLIRHF